MAIQVLRRLAVAALLMLAGCRTTSAVVQPDRLKATDALVAEAIASGSLPGSAYAVAQDGWIVASRSFGVADIQTKEAVTQSTLFRLGSISKFVAAAAAMRLVESGKIALTDQVSDILKDRPGLSKPLTGITVEQLLNHTSGLPDLSSQELGKLVLAGTPVADAEIMSAMQRPPRSRPGETWSYNNSGYRVVSWIVEKASGRPFDDYVTSELAPALGLKSLQPCDLARGRMARGYIAAEGKVEPDPSYSVRGLLGDGGLCANVEDLALLPGRLTQTRWISVRALETMIGPTELGDGTMVDYGLGVRRGVIGDQRFWGHSGSGLAGGWAALAHYPDRRMTIAVLGNGSGGSTDAIVLQAKIAAALLDQQGLRDDNVDALINSALPFAFEADGTKVCFGLGPAGVTRKVAGATGEPRALLYQGHGAFARSDYPLDRYVFQMAGGRPVAHRVYYDGFFAELLRPTGLDGC